MKGRLVDFSLNLATKKQRVTVELDSDFREGFDSLHDADVEVTIKKWRAKRSKDANAYFHVILNQIAQATGQSDEIVKAELIVRYGAIARDTNGNPVGIKLPAAVDVSRVYPYTRLYKSVTEDGRDYNCFLLYKHSSDMDTKEMSHLIDGTVAEARELGIDCDTPEMKARLQ